MPHSALEENRKARFEHGCIWGLVSIGDTYTKTCCKQLCTCTCEHLDGVWCPERKDICVNSSWKFMHVTQLESPYARAVSAAHSHRCHSPRKHDRHTATFVETLCVRDDPSLTQSLLEFPEHINKNTSWEIVDVYVHQSLVRLNNI